MTKIWRSVDDGPWEEVETMTFTIGDIPASKVAFKLEDPIVLRAPSDEGMKVPENLVVAATWAIRKLAAQHWLSSASPSVYARGVLRAVMDPKLRRDRLVPVGEVLDLLAAPQEYAVDSDSNLSAKEYLEEKLLGET